MKSTPVKLVCTDSKYWHLLEVVYPYKLRHSLPYYFVPRRTKHPKNRYVHIRLTDNYYLRVNANNLGQIHIIATYLSTLATEIEAAHKADIGPTYDIRERTTATQNEIPENAQC
jgi:hypothetical protein